jgi:nitrate/nitrite transport system substrate-binding protein
MSTFDDPFNAEAALLRHGCSCGRHASEAEHDANAEEDQRNRDV